MMRSYSVTLTGKNPLLMHHDNIDWSDKMKAWQTNPDNSKASSAGDDRTPGWRWLGSVYQDEKHIVIPSENIMRALMEAGKMVPTGKRGATFKAQTQSGMMSEGTRWTFLVNGEQIPWGPCDALQAESAFDKHVAAVEAMGFQLFVKRARIGKTKHVRVRPMFRNWQALGTLTVWDDQITEAALSKILEFAGQYKGIGDWRPGGITPGPFGTFTAEVAQN